MSEINPNVQQRIDAGDEDALDMLTDEQLAEQLRKQEANGTQADAGTVTAVKFNAEKGELEIETAGTETAEEQARKAAETAANAGKTPEQIAAEETERKRDAAVTKAQAQWEELVKVHPELQEMLPEELREAGLKGVLGKLRPAMDPPETKTAGQLAEERAQQRLEAVRQTPARMNPDTLKALVTQEALPKLRELGIEEMPATEAERDKLYDELFDKSPSTARRFERILDEAEQTVKDSYRATTMALAEKDVHDTQVLTKDLEVIVKLNRDSKLGLTDGQIQEFATKVVQQNEAYTLKHGVPFLRDHALVDAFKREHEDQLLQAIVDSRVAQRVRETLDGVIKHAPQTVVAGAAGAAQTRTKRNQHTINLQDEDAIDQLTDEQLQRAIATVRKI